MCERKRWGIKLSRRHLLKAGLMGGSALPLLGFLGCGEEVQEPSPKETEGARKGLIRPVRSPWYQALEGDRIQCTLCPRGCALEEGERSPCRVRENREGKMYTLAYGNPALVQEDPVERKPFFHVIPGSRALSISTAGCNLSCKFCEVWDMALVSPEEIFAYDMPPETVVAQARGAGVRAVSYAFGEPVIFHEYMTEVAIRAREAGLLNLVHTAGFILEEPLRDLLKLVDAVNVDLKSFDPAFYSEVVGGEIEPVLRTLGILAEEGVHLEITTVIIPTLNDDMDQITRMSRWIVQELGEEVPLHLSRFYPLYQLSGLPRTPVSTLDRARETAMEAGLRYVYVAKVTGHDGENTFCGGCGERVIKRKGFVIDEVRLTDGVCPHCGTQIPGLWS